MGVHTVVSSIPIRKRSVGMLDVWVNVLLLVLIHVQHLVTADVLIMILNLVLDIKLVKVEVVMQDVH